MTPAIRKILVPVDFSPSSRLAFEYAAVLADRLDAAIHVLHVWEVPVFLHPDLTVGAGNMNATLTDHIQKEAETSMQAFLADVRAAERKSVTSAVVFGLPYTTIVASIEQGHYDLVALGTHGRTGLSHLLLGSVAERVVRHAKCPVLTIRG